MSRYKVLPIPNQFETKFAEMFENNPWDRPNKIDPIFNRVGLYLDRKTNTCWVETIHGSWIVGDKKFFENELYYRASIEDILHPKVIKALSVLRTHNLLSRQLKDKWHAHYYAMMLRNTKRNSMKWRIKILGK